MRDGIRKLPFLFGLWMATAHAKEAPRFSHKTHAKLMGAAGIEGLKCPTCHAQDPKTREPLPAGRDAHKPCSDARCHGPRLDAIVLPDGGGALCGGCHEKADKHQVSPPRFIHREDGTREFGWRINHRRHMQVPGLDRCDTCHTLTKSVAGDEVTVLAHRPGHLDCAPCHGKSGSKPSLDECGDCHRPGEVTHAKPTAATAFRVYEKFTHDTHRLDIRTARAKPGGAGRGWSRYDRATAQTLSCGACHTTAAKAESIKEMDLLGACAMNKTCMGQCHNGRFAFGTGMNDCFLCHSKEAEKATPPRTHCGE